MPIIGFNFDKIFAERKGVAGPQINVKHNLSIKDIEKNDFSFGENKRQILKVSFIFSVDYEKTGNISLDGFLLYMENEKKQKEILDKWKNEKKIEKGLSELLFNAILLKCNVKGLNLAQDVNLPPHFNLPRLAASAKAENYIG